MATIEETKENYENMSKVEDSKQVKNDDSRGAVVKAIEDMKEEAYSEDTLRDEVKELVGDGLSPEEYEELESVLYSISSGKVCLQNK